jgi:hypothetical protein
LCPGVRVVSPVEIDVRKSSFRDSIFGSRVWVWVWVSRSQPEMITRWPFKICILRLLQKRKC